MFDFSSERFGLLLFPLSRCCVSGTGCQQFSASLLRRWYKTVSKFFRNLAAERQRPQEAHQVESGNKIWQAVFCAARAASSTQARPMAGQGRSPCGLGGSKGGHSSDKNGPLSLCCALRSNCCKTAWTSRPSGMLGHFSAGFTLDTYAHVTTSAKREAAKTMGSILSGAV